MKLYMGLIVITILFPLILSWDKKVQFYKQFKALCFAILIVGGAFVIWDVWYTKIGIWGFNEVHLLGQSFWGLPLEEILFFVVVPYACVFIHDTLNVYWPVQKTIKKVTYLTLGLMLLSLLLVIGYANQYYTVSIGISTSIVAGILWTLPPIDQQRLWRSFLVVMIPFLLVNGALTGAFTNEPVVWYNAEEMLGIRLYTIPLEDVFYNFSLIVGVIMLRNLLNQKNDN